MADHIARDVNGIPHLTERQQKRVHRYAVDLVRTGTSKRSVTPVLLAAGLCELAWHAADVRWQLEQFIAGSATAIPARQVALVALHLLSTMQHMAPADQAMYLRTLLGDDTDTDSNTDTATNTHTH